MDGIKFKLKVYPITEDGEVIYKGGTFDVIRLELDTGYVYTIREYGDALLFLSDHIMGGNRLESWNVKDNRDGRDELNELYLCLEDDNMIRVYL